MDKLVARESWWRGYGVCEEEYDDDAEMRKKRKKMEDEKRE